MNENALYINLGQIPGGVKLVENYSSRFVSCIQQDCMQESMMILQGLAGVIGEINRNLIWNPLYRLFGCNIKTMKRYMWMLADTSDGSRLFDRAHGEYLDTFMIEGSFPIQTPFSFSVTTEPADSMNLSLTVHDNVLGIFPFTLPLPELMRSIYKYGRCRDESIYPCIPGQSL